MKNAVAIVAGLLDEGVKDDIMSAYSPENYKVTLIRLLTDEDDFYTPNYDPPDSFIADMLKQEKSPVEAAELWLEWDELMEERGEWITEIANEKNWDIDDFNSYWDDNHAGEANSDEEFAESYAREVEEVPERWESYIDWGKYAKDLMHGYLSYEASDGTKHYFRYD